MEFRYRDEPNQTVLIAGGVAFLMPQHCSFLCPASHSCFIKTSFLYFWYPYFCCWGEAALLLKSATNENCPWHFKLFIFLPETATSRQKWQWAICLVAFQPPQLVAWQQILPCHFSLSQDLRLSLELSASIHFLPLQPQQQQPSPEDWQQLQPDLVILLC